MEVSKISFTGLAQTKKGNLYNKTNTGKNIGTIAGLGAGALIATTSTKAQLGALEIATKLTKNVMKLPTTTKVVLAAGVLLLGLAGRLLGAIPDRIVNKSRIAKADAKAENV